MKSFIRRFLNNRLGLRIYRGTLPFGADLFKEIEKTFGLQTIETIFDIGANVGQSAVRYSDFFPGARIHSFEPVEGTYARLLEKVLHRRNIFPHKMALGDKSGLGAISVNENSQHNSLLSGAGVSTEQVMISTVDEFCTQEAIDRVDFMKIDTEGYEFEVLGGARRMLSEQRINILQLEAEPGRSGGHFVNMGDLADYLRPFGYELFGIFDQYCERGRLLYCNPVFLLSERSRH